MKAQTANGVDRQQRRWDIDWLRVLAVLLLFYFHPAKIFYSWGGWYIENVQKSRALSYISLFMEHWHMPVFFILAGASTWFALRRRTGGQYVAERVKRLLVPFVFGLLVIVPPQIYFDLLSNRRYSGSYLEFYPSFFSARYTDGFDMGHLWFILYLFLFSLMALPLFLYLKRDSGQRLTGRLAALFSRPGMIFLLVLPLIVMDALLPHFYPNPLYFLVFFIYGYILISDERLGEAIDRHKEVALILGLVIYVVWLSLVVRNVIDPDWLKPVRASLIGWCSLIALMGYGRRYLGFANGFLRYFGEAGYALYILHQTVIVVIGYYVVQWNTGVLIKLLTIIVASFVITTALYDVLVKRTNVTRFLFGMRPRKPVGEA